MGYYWLRKCYRIVCREAITGGHSNRTYDGPKPPNTSQFNTPEWVLNTMYPRNRIWNRYLRNVTWVGNNMLLVRDTYNQATEHVASTSLPTLPWVRFTAVAGVENV